uniref:Uncharacterized protein n=2 Tax=Viruses TaxID=10239 RepID=A0AAU8GJG3_9CAUD
MQREKIKGETGGCSCGGVKRLVCCVFKEELRRFGLI